ncbi:hypothetical protein DB346_17195 [Verrucomicrobia bacterium LW23]|nr:hypothetical protein DB346_17195 [Verrucomicrobia bacterium LW23]
MTLTDLMDRAITDLSVKTQVHATTWDYGQEDEWSLNQEEGKLIWTFANRIVTAPAQIIGTYDASIDESNGSWMWSWANPSIEPQMAEDAEHVRTFGEHNRHRVLQRPSYDCTLDDGWTFAALAMHLNGRQGVYKGTDGDTHIFIAFGTVSVGGLALSGRR